MSLLIKNLILQSAFAVSFTVAICSCNSNDFTGQYYLMDHHSIQGIVEIENNSIAFWDANFDLCDSLFSVRTHFHIDRWTKKESGYTLDVSNGDEKQKIDLSDHRRVPPSLKIDNYQFTLQQLDYSLHDHRKAPTKNELMGRAFTADLVNIRRQQAALSDDISMEARILQAYLRSFEDELMYLYGIDRLGLDCWYEQDSLFIHKSLCERLIGDYPEQPKTGTFTAEEIKSEIEKYLCTVNEVQLTTIFFESFNGQKLTPFRMENSFEVPWSTQYFYGSTLFEVILLLNRIELDILRIENLRKSSLLEATNK